VAMEGVCLQRRNRTISKGYDAVDPNLHLLPGERCGLDAILNAAAGLPLAASEAAAYRERTDEHSQENDGRPMKK
jgi:hypothetical protein